ncbi:MAG: hypothetical protein ACYC56_08225 [Candidatus Aquicultor sp.]
MNIMGIGVSATTFILLTGIDVNKSRSLDIALLIGMPVVVISQFVFRFNNYNLNTTRCLLGRVLMKAKTDTVEATVAKQKLVNMVQEMNNMAQALQKKL